MGQVADEGDDAEITGGADGALALSDFVTYRITRLHAQLNAQASAILRDNGGLTLAQYRILALVANFGPASSAVLTRNSNFDKGQFSRKLRTLVERGLVHTAPDPGDQRVQLLSLSAAGRRMYDRVAPLMLERQNHLRAALGMARIERLFSDISALGEAAERRDF